MDWTSLMSAIQNAGPPQVGGGGDAPPQGAAPGFPSMQGAGSPLGMLSGLMQGQGQGQGGQPQSKANFAQQYAAQALQPPKIQPMQWDQPGGVGPKLQSM